MFLWVLPNGQKFPIGFALWYQGSGKLPAVALRGLSVLRNHFEDLKPLGMLGDGGYSKDELIKRLTDYGWPLVVRIACDRTLDGKQVRQQIPRGYGVTEGKLENGVKLKVSRKQKHFLACNRMGWESEAIHTIYRLRWKIEEVFRALKTCFGMDGCQQHSMRAQANYLGICLILYTTLEIVSGGNVYSAWTNVISGSLQPENILPKIFFNTF